MVYMFFFNWNFKKVNLVIFYKMGWAQNGQVAENRIRGYYNDLGRMELRKDESLN